MLEVCYDKYFLEQVFKTVIFDLSFGLNNHDINCLINEAIFRVLQKLQLKGMMLFSMYSPEV